MTKKSKNKKNILDKYNQPIFVVSNLYIIITDKPEKLKYNQFTERDGTPVDISKEADGYDGLTLYGLYCKNEPCVIVVIKADSSTKTANVTAHEALHVAHRILDYNDIKLQDGTQEVFANMVGWANQCITASYNKWLKQ